ncbi:CvpA family protein [Lapidilactobacillus luobeiensis]|uniref:CvpA family protein n=1 Tax=Lapidilactobacillus luobeiensis TaxID=2950371 RepID=UPI0021C25B42|nr:CvpA family protein [Lapidilactobacillus luobeiensis]
MLSFVIILIFAYNLYIGARRGLYLQGAYTIGYLISLLFARIFYVSLASKLDLLIPYPSATLDSHFAFFSSEVGLGLDQAFYRGVAFILILVVGWLLTHLLMLFFSDLAYLELPLIDHWASLAGSLFLAFVVTYFGLFCLCYLLAVIPIPGIQNALQKSWLATLIVRYTPILTKWVTALWVA